MTETPAEFTGTGTESNPLTFDAMRPSAPDPAHQAVASMAVSARTHAAGFRNAADLSSNLPADVREVVSKASDAIIAPLGTATNARIKADSFAGDITMPKEGRTYLAGETIKAANNKIAESFEQAEALLDVASAMTYESARPIIAPDAALTARADLQMITQRHNGNPAGLVDTLKRLAQRSDSVGALVADSGYLADFLFSQGADQQLSEAAMAVVRAEVVKAAAASGDPKRAAAAKTNLALVELRKARAAALSFTRHILNG